MMLNILYNAELWRQHAAEARAIAETLSDPKAKQQMLDIAARFDRIAGLAVKLRSMNATSARALRLTKSVLVA